MQPGIGVVIRKLIVPLVVVILGSGARVGGAEPSEVAPSQQAALAEAEGLGKQVAQLRKQGKFADAVPIAERSLSLREKELGSLHPVVAASLHSLGEIYASLNQYGKGVPLLTRALDIREKALGPQHPDVAESLDLLASMYGFRGEYDRALPLFIRALEIREKALGRRHPDVAETLTNLAALYLERGAYAKAESLLLRALTIREKALGPTNSDVAETLSYLAGSYYEQGAYTKAEPLFLRVLGIFEEALGPMHPDLAPTVNSLGLLYLEQGAYVKAEVLIVRSLDIREQALGAMHPAVATSLNNLAMLYNRRGASEKAESLYTRALDILENTLGREHPRVAGALDNLATLYGKQGVYGKAEQLHLRALDIYEKIHGPMHYQVAYTLHNLAGMYLEQGAHAKAEPLYLRALDIWEKTYGLMSPHVAACLGNLASLYTDHGAYRKAESLYLRALRIDERMLGPTHTDLARHLRGLGRLYRMEGAHEKALPLLSRAVEISEVELRTELGRLSEPRRRALVTTLNMETASAVSFHVDAMPTSARALEFALSTVLRRKGRILDSLAETQATLRSHLTPRLRTQLDQLAQARTELSRRLYSSSDPRDAAKRAAAIATLRERVEGLEASLGTASLEFRAQSAPVTLAKVQAALLRGTMLVELVRYQGFARGRVEQRLQPDRYVAYLVTRQGRPRWIALGEAAPIDAAVDAALAVLHRGGARHTSKEALQTLDRLLFAPIRARLTDVSHVILAPDSKLNLVPFEALVDAQGRYEIEHRLISYVTSGRDLLRLATRRSPRSPAVLVASPDYGPLASPEAQATRSFAPLAGATAEREDLQRFFSTAPVTGANATKGALAALRGPAILHVATHGFYARDAAVMGSPLAPSPAATTAKASSTSLARRGLALSAGSSPPPSRQPDDPLDGLDQAGLAMAGANQGADGIVTAREIAGFDWWGTKLVVLSACETGVGAVPSGDGVYGLRRAVVLAGAEAQVVSLWNVNDSSSQALMREYYDELARGIGRGEALRQAKLRLLRQARYAHPHYWAPFILAGDWTPLDKRVFQQHKPIQ